MAAASSLGHAFRVLLAAIKVLASAGINLCDASQISFKTSCGARPTPVLPGQTHSVLDPSVRSCTEQGIAFDTGLLVALDTPPKGGMGWDRWSESDIHIERLFFEPEFVVSRTSDKGPEILVFDF